MLFSALLRLASNVDNETTREVVDINLHQMELWEQRSALVGSLSLEQTKRLAVGVELVANPSILLLDGPTSGLDHKSATIVMRTVHRITQDGRTVIATLF